MARQQIIHNITDQYSVGSLGFLFDSSDLTKPSERSFKVCSLLTG